MIVAVAGVLSMVEPAAMIPSWPVLPAMSVTASSFSSKMKVPSVQLVTVIV